MTSPLRQLTYTVTTLGLVLGPAPLRRITKPLMSLVRFPLMLNRFRRLLIMWLVRISRTPLPLQRLISPLPILLMPQKLTAPLIIPIPQWAEHRLALTLNRLPSRLHIRPPPPTLKALAINWPSLPKARKQDSRSAVLPSVPPPIGATRIVAGALPLLGLLNLPVDIAKKGMSK